MRPLNLEGYQIGKLTVVSSINPPDGKTGRWWKCRCSCGKLKLASTGSLTGKRPTKSCGCLFWDKMASRSKDISGRKFGKLTAINIAHKSKHGNFWYCKCDCGKEATIRIGHLISGRTVSCGCSYADYWDSMKDEMAKYKAIYRNYKSSAQKRNLEFSLSFEEFYKLITQNCFYCNSSGNNVRKYKNEDVIYNGIDRVDNTIGYIMSNCVPCCAVCNRAKNKYSLDLFIEWINRISNNQSNLMKKIENTPFFDRKTPTP